MLLPFVPVLLRSNSAGHEALSCLGFKCLCESHWQMSMHLFLDVLDVSSCTLPVKLTCTTLMLHFIYLSCQTEFIM